MAEQLTDREFTTASGRTYRENILLTLPRYREFQKLHVHLLSGSDYRQWHAQVGQAYAILGDRKGNIVDAGRILYNVLEGVKREVDEGQSVHLKLLALFYNEAGEDAAVFDAEAMKAKMADWEVSGLPAAFFIRNAFRLVLSALEELLPATPNPHQPQ